MEMTYQNNHSESVASTVGQKEEKHFIPRSRLTDYLSEVRKEDIPWAVNFLVSQLAIAHEPIKPERKHVWEDYKLSAEIEALSSFERKSLPSDYGSALMDALEEKHQ
jgi:hypothetical protein